MTSSKNNGLNNQWVLEDMIKNCRKLEAVTTGTRKLSEEGAIRGVEDNVNRVSRVGKYSKKYQRGNLFKKKTSLEK